MADLLNGPFLQTVADDTLYEGTIKCRLSNTLKRCIPSTARLGQP